MDSLKTTSIGAFWWLQSNTRSSLEEQFWWTWTCSSALEPWSSIGQALRLSDDALRDTRGSHSALN